MENLEIYLLPIKEAAKMLGATNIKLQGHLTFNLNGKSVCVTRPIRQPQYPSFGVVVNFIVDGEIQNATNIQESVPLYHLTEILANKEEEKNEEAYWEFYVGRTTIEPNNWNELQREHAKIEAKRRKTEEHIRASLKAKNCYPPNILPQKEGFINTVLGIFK